MLEALTKEDWAKRLNETIIVKSENGSECEMKLVDVVGFGRSYGGGREAYSLYFTGPSAPILPQRIYPVRNAVLGDLDLFLVPIGPNPSGMGYEAVFT